MRYELKHALTVSGVGCFAAQPGPNLSFNEMLDHLRASPMDEFMHLFVLEALAGHRTRKVEKLINSGLDSDPVLKALLMEAMLVHSRFDEIKHLLADQDPAASLPHTPLIHLKALAREDQPLHNAWNRLLHANIAEHADLPAPDRTGLEPVYSQEELAALPDHAVTAAEIRESLAPSLPAPKERPPLAETIARAEEALKRKDVFVAVAMQHKACLAPIALLQHWMADSRASSGRNAYTLTGMQTAYGRGFEMDNAKASLFMEVAERASSYGSFGKKSVSGLNREAPLWFGSAEAVSANGPTLDMTALRLEVPYAGEEIYWTTGHGPDGKGGQETILIPPQLAYLFCNLDEPSLTSGLGSTGLASGNTLEEAKVAGLCEAIERHAEAVTPFTRDRLFTLESDDPRVAKLLADYRDCGINVCFADLTPEFGVPCYKAFVLGDRHGDVNKGTGAGLSGPRAAVSAMTEIPYPFPGPKTRPVPRDIPARRLEDLPDLTTGSAEGDLMVLEQTFLANGLKPAYVELTRKDLGIPTVRAIAPGLEFMTDMDRFARVSPRLWANYLKLWRDA